MTTTLLNLSKNKPILVVMGVSGCGKTTIAKRLSSNLSIPFIEGDELHPASNIEKMKQSIPLTDIDRWPWLDRLGAALKTEHMKTNQSVVASCSALKKSYRERLKNAANHPILFIYLEGSRATLLKRLHSREDHFMPSSLLDSQLDTLEYPEDDELSLTVSIENSIETMVNEVLSVISQ